MASYNGSGTPDQTTLSRLLSQYRHHYHPAVERVVLIEVKLNYQDAERHNGMIVSTR